MIRVLNITSILPISSIQHKKDENDILLITEDKLKEKYNDLKFLYIFIIPDTNKVLSLLSKKWRSYFALKRQKSILLRGRKIFILGVIQFPKIYFFRNWFYELSFFLNRKLINEVISDFKPTIIHAHNTDCDAYLAKKIRKIYNIPYIITLRGLEIISDSIVKENILTAENLIALSPIQAEKAKSYWTGKIEVIPHGIPNNFYREACWNDKELGEFRFISVCRLLKLKNLDLVLRALSELERNFIFHIYGDGPERENLELLIEKLKLGDKVKFMGFVNQKKLPDILKRYHLFIMPSYPEALGRVYFEAMAGGLPVIGSKNTGIDGIIVHGQEGYLVEPNSLEDLTMVLTQLPKDLKELKTMGENGYLLAQKYSWDKIAEKLFSIYSGFDNEISEKTTINGIDPIRFN